MENSKEQIMAALEAVKKYFPDSIGSFQKHIEEIPKIDPEKIESYTLFLDILAEFIQSNEMFQFKKMTLGAFIKKYIKNIKGIQQSIKLCFSNRKFRDQMILAIKAFNA